MQDMIMTAAAAATATATATTTTSLKEQKEAFVTGHEGTSRAEILLVCASGVIGYWLYAVLPVGWTRARPLSTEVFLFWLPMILVQSNFLYPVGVAYVAVEALLAVVLEVRSSSSSRGSSSSVDSSLSSQSHQDNDPQATTSPTNNQQKQQQQQQQHGALTMHRAIVMYLTFCAILAVDFPLFPRRFVKTETAGYSLMDVGAASFALVAGWVSPRARQRQGRGMTQKLLKRMAPLIFMGSLRLVTHQELDYQEHHSEYGIHWNFFYTLAALGPLTAILPGPTWWVPTAIMMTYQYCLSRAGLQEFIEEAPRSCVVVKVEESSMSSLSLVVCDLFMANREGILGCIGYVSVYLISEWIGSKVLWDTSLKTDTVKLLLYASASVVILWRLVIALGIPISRRSTNLGFLLWTLVVNLPLFTCIMIIYRRHAQVPLVARLVNRHGLACFVAANLLTGIVNLSINTLQVDDSTAIAILIAYLTAVGIFALLLDGIVSRFRKPKQN